MIPKKRKQKKRNKILDYMAYLGLRGFAMFVHMLPQWMVYKFAASVADFYFNLGAALGGKIKFARKHRHRTMEHLRLSFPDYSEEKLTQIARDSVRNMVYLSVEVILTTRLITPERLPKYARLVNMSEMLRLLLENKTGIISLTGHFGNWEVAGYTTAALGFPNTAIARSLDNPHLNEFMLGTRQNTGMQILDKRGAASVVPGLLADKQCVGFIADQDAGRKGLFVDFFGRKASTYKSIGLLAMQFNTPVVIGYSKRVGDRFFFEIGIEKIIHPQDWQDQDDPLRYITQEYTSAIESMVRKAPEQYLWTHRRWKHRPKGEPPAVDGIA